MYKFGLNTLQNSCAINCRRNTITHHRIFITQPTCDIMCATGIQWNRACLRRLHVFNSAFPRAIQFFLLLSHSSELISYGKHTYYAQSQQQSANLWSPRTRARFLFVAPFFLLACVRRAAAIGKRKVTASAPDIRHSTMTVTLSYVNFSQPSSTVMTCMASSTWEPDERSCRASCSAHTAPRCA